MCSDLDSDSKMGICKKEFISQTPILSLTNIQFSYMIYPGILYDQMFCLFLSKCNIISIIRIITQFMQVNGCMTGIQNLPGARMQKYQLIVFLLGANTNSSSGVAAPQSALQRCKTIGI